MTPDLIDEIVEWAEHNGNTESCWAAADWLTAAYKLRHPSCGDVRASIGTAVNQLVIRAETLATAGGDGE